MPVFGILIVALQIFFAVHAVRTGKDTIWLWIIVFVPGIGCALYFITQFGPEAANSRAARRARNSLLKAVDPQRELRRRTDMLAAADTVQNRLALADECIEAGMYVDAIALLKGALTGVHADDPAIMERLARAEFDNDLAADAMATLDALIAANPAYRSPDGHLLYARALEVQGRYEEAVKEYEVLRESYPGEEARVRYGVLLKTLGRFDEAKTLFEEALTRARRAPRHYRKKQQAWLSIARQNLG